MEDANPEAMSSTVVLGTAMGYSADQLRPFIRSLRRCGYGGDVILLVDRSVASAVASDPDFAGVALRVAPFWFPMKFGWMKRPRRMWVARIILFPGWVLMRLLALLRTTRPLAETLAMRVVPPTESRFIHYARILRDSRYGRVLITDVRDVLFQVDPFEVLDVDALAVGMESDRYRLGDERWNAWFIERAYGPAMLEQLREFPVSCSGVTYGSNAAMLHYLGLMASEIVRLRFVATLQPLDQGLHNKLLWTGAVGDFVRLEAFNGAIGTVHPDDDDFIVLDEAGYFLNRNGSRIAVLHQYDRLPRWREYLLERFTA